MELRLFKVVSIIFLTIYVLILVSSCNIQEDITSNNGGDIIEQLQKEVPFTIIVPTYLPMDISSYPTGILGPGKGVTDNSVAVGFGYSSRGSNTKFIDIYEESGQVIFHPSGPSSLYLEIRGVRVLEEEAELVIQSESPSDSTMLYGYFYGWNQNEVNFKVTIYGYDRSESRKVVESMIKQ